MSTKTTPSSFFTKQNLWPIAAIFGITGIAMLLHSSAAAGNHSLEAEKGTTSGKAQVALVSGGFSGEGYVTLNGGTTGGGGGLNPIPETLPNGSWYDINGGKFETTRLKLLTGSTTTYHVTNYGKYSGGNIGQTVNAGGVTSYFDTATGKDYVKTASGPSGVLMTHFETNYIYDTNGDSFGSPSANGDCVTASYSGGDYEITACKAHNALKIVNKNFGPQAEEDKFFLPGNADTSTFSIINAPEDATSHAGLVEMWSQADQCGAAGEGWGRGDALTGYCVVETLGGNINTVFYKDHIIAGFYDKASGQGVGMVFSKGYGNFFGEGKVFKAWNPTFPFPNYLSFEYLTDDAPQTKYFFVLHNGRAELETVGKAILDGEYF